jgi:hypothetical protein|tara:strand:- start:228 stop:332 length:105 start_codon:yes stop_codon:yes gene_type:complete
LGDGGGYEEEKSVREIICLFVFMERQMNKIDLNE